ncbi:alcohol dehydrogenase-like isoform X2 [Tubulanus polymorphus]|uniref:alcohol dehydrogenase-like isoform X2 n=1 Tax=Tubulanus polymorphus TaxID=672921 RepID=UPI003DA6CDF1
MTSSPDRLSLSPPRSPSRSPSRSPMPVRRALSIADPLDVVFDEDIALQKCYMRRCRRKTVADAASEGIPVPDVPEGGVRVRVCYAGACYTNEHAVKTHWMRLSGVRDSSLFPGFEVSGIVDEICKTVAGHTKFAKGDRIIVFPGPQVIGKLEFSEYITVSDPQYLIHLPSEMPLEEAALLPTGALTAYNAILEVRRISERIMSQRGRVNIMISGAGGLGLLTLNFAKYFFGKMSNVIRIVVTDSSIDKLMDAEEIGCYDAIHWEDQLYEPQLIDRVFDVFNDGVDIAIDYAGSFRTLTRILKCLNQGGRLLVPGSCETQSEIDMADVSRNELGIVTIPQGTIEQLQEIVKLFASGQILPPPYSVYPIEDIVDVYHDLATSKIHGRAVLKVAGSEDVF